MRKTATDIHWDSRPKSVTDHEKVNIDDVYQRQLETDFILGHLHPQLTALEVGCGNGYLTDILRERVQQVDAFDYSAPMISQATELYGETNNRFFQASVLDPESVSKRYDAAICVRVLINLVDLEEQKVALHNMHSWLVPEGRLIIVEGFRDGFEELNVARERAGLETMRPANINFYSYFHDLQPVIEDLFVVEESFHSGCYDFLTRVVYPCLEGADKAVGPSDFHKKIMPIASELNMDAFRIYARLHGKVLRKR